MSNYTQNVSYGPKDALTQGDPNKAILGTQIDAELSEISTAISSKEDAANKGQPSGYAPLNSSTLLADSYLTTNIPKLDAAATISASWVFSTAPQVSTIEVGHATDTTLSRVSAGRVAVEGNALARVGVAETISAAWTFNALTVFDTGAAAQAFNINSTHVSGPWGSLSRSGTAFGDIGNGAQMGGSFTLDSIALNARGTVLELGTSNTMRVRVSDTSLYTTGTIELGHATDTTLARVSAGVVAIEGANVVTETSGDARYKKQGRNTIPIMAAAMIPAATNGPGQATVTATTNLQTYKTLDFDQTTQEFAHFQIPFPKGWNEGTITFQPIWTAAAGTGGVVWELEAVAVSNDDAIDVAWGTAQSSTDTLLATGDIHVGPESAAITIAGTPAADDLVFFRIKRAPANASDTLTGDARLIGIRIFYTDNAADDTP